MAKDDPKSDAQELIHAGEAYLYTGQDFLDLLDLFAALINSPSLPEIPEQLSNTIEIRELYDKVVQLRDAMRSFSQGDFSRDIRLSGACAGFLKALQGNVRHLNWQVRTVAEGDFTQRVTFMGELSKSFNEMTEKLDRTVQRLTSKEEELLALTSELKQEINARIKIEKSLRASEARYRKMAVYDWLTGVYNRRHFMELAQGELGRSKRSNLPMSVAMLDVDHFKLFNDTYGHLNGDTCLQHVARIINSSVRRMDIVARYGGEEFVVLLPETDLDTALVVAERVRSSLESSPVKLDHGNLASITASLGVAEVERTLKGHWKIWFQKQSTALTGLCTRPRLPGETGSKQRCRANITPPGSSSPLRRHTENLRNTFPLFQSILTFTFKRQAKGF